MNEKDSVNQRQQKILLLLELSENITAKVLSQRFHVTHDVIEKDLRQLEKAGLMRRDERPDWSLIASERRR